MEHEPIETVYVYRFANGSTQVRAPECDDTELVIDMLEEALRAMHEGQSVQRQ